MLRRAMTRIILAPYRGAIAEVLSFFEINPESFAGLPLDIQRHHEKGYYFSVLEGLYTALDKGFGSGTKDKHSLNKLSALLNEALGSARNANHVAYWQEHLGDVAIGIFPNKSQWELNKHHAFAYDGYITETSGVHRRALFISPHILNPVISVKARKFLLTLVISKFMAEDWAKKQRESASPNKRYKAIVRRIKLLGIKESQDIDRAVANLLIARELVRNPSIVNQKKAALAYEPLSRLRLGDEPPNFFTGLHSILESIPLSPKYTQADIWETFLKAQNQTTHRGSRREGVPIELGRIYAITQHYCLRDGTPLPEASRLQVFSKFTANAQWLAHKKQPLEVILAAMLVGLGDIDPDKFRVKLNELKKDKSFYIRSAAVLAEVQHRWSKCVSYAPQVPRFLDDNYYEQNELDRVVGCWTTAAQEYVQALHENEKTIPEKYRKIDATYWQAYADDGWKKVREHVAFLTASKFIFDLNRDYSNLDEKSLITKAFISRFSIIRGLRKIQLSDVADKLDHEAFALRGGQFYAIDQMIRDSLGMGPEESESFVRSEGQKLKAMLEFHGIDCEVTGREKKSVSERGKIIDTYRDNLDRMIKGEKSLFATDNPKIADIHRLHFDTLGLKVSFASQEQIQEAWKILSDYIESSKSDEQLPGLIEQLLPPGFKALIDKEKLKVEDLIGKALPENFNSLNPQHRHILDIVSETNKKILDFRCSYDPKTGMNPFLRTNFFVSRTSYNDTAAIVPMDLHMETQQFSFDSKDGIADLKGLKAHLDMKYTRDVINFAFFSFLREKGVSFNEEGMPVSVNEVLAHYPEFLKIEQNYKPFRDYQNRKSPVESALKWDAVTEAFTIEPPTEIIVAVLNEQEGTFKNIRMISGSDLAEIGLDETGRSKVPQQELIHTLNAARSIYFPGVMVRMTDASMYVPDAAVVSPRGVAQILKKRFVLYDPLRTPAQAIDKIVGDSILSDAGSSNVPASDDMQSIIRVWREKLFAPVAGNYGLSEEELMLLIACGERELQKSLPSSYKTVRHIIEKVSQRLEQSFVRISAEDVYHYQDRHSFGIDLDFDERRRGLVPWFLKHLAHQASLENLQVSLLDLTVSYPDDETHSFGVCERNTFEVTLWNMPSDDKERQDAICLFEKVLKRTLSLVPYDLMSRIEVTPARTVDRELSVVLPQESLSSKKFIDCLFELGLGIKKTISIDPKTGRVSLLISGEEMRNYKVTSIEELQTSKYKSEEIGNLRSATEKLKQGIQKELLRVDENGIPLYFSEQDARTIIESLEIIDPVH